MKKMWLSGLVLGLLMIGAAFCWMRGVDPVSSTVTVSQPGGVQPVDQVPDEEGLDNARSATGAASSKDTATARQQAKEINGNEHKHGHEHEATAGLPSPATIEAVRQLGSPAGNSDQPVTLPDGSVEMQLGNRFRSVPVATVGKDGKVQVDYHGEKYMQEQQVESKP